MQNNPYLYILIMAGVTYAVRVLPLALMQKEMKNIYIRSFLYYVPYVTLSVMIFPAILGATSHMVSALAGFIVAVVLAFRGKSLITVSLFACAVVFAVELFLV